MSNESIQERVTRIVCNQMGTTADKVNAETSFVNDLGAEIDGEGEVAAVVEFSAPLPLRNRNQGNITVSKVAIDQAMAKKSDVEALNRELLVRAHTEFESARYESKLLKQSTMSAARSVHQTTIDRYHQGEIDYLPVFSAERKLLELELMMIAVGKRYHSAVAELDRLTMITPSNN